MELINFFNFFNKIMKKCNIFSKYYLKKMSVPTYFQLHPCNVTSTTAGTQTAVIQQLFSADSSLSSCTGTVQYVDCGTRLRCTTKYTCTTSLPLALVLLLSSLVQY